MEEYAAIMSIFFATSGTLPAHSPLRRPKPVGPAESHLWARFGRPTVNCIELQDHKFMDQQEKGVGSLV